MDSYWRNELNRSGIVVGEDEEIPIGAYRSIAMEKDEVEVRRALVGMGRPLLASTFLAAMDEHDNVAGVEYDTRKARRAVDAVLSLAARKLMAGRDPSSLTNYNKDSLFGVASLLCRLGLRPHSTSSFAS